MINSVIGLFPVEYSLAVLIMCGCVKKLLKLHLTSVYFREMGGHTLS